MQLMRQIIKFLKRENMRYVLKLFSFMVLNKKLIIFSLQFQLINVRVKMLPVYINLAVIMLI